MPFEQKQLGLLIAEKCLVFLSDFAAFYLYFLYTFLVSIRLSLRAQVKEFSSKWMVNCKIGCLMRIRALIRYSGLNR
jgi:hypothetical protein